MRILGCMAAATIVVGLAACESNTTTVVTTEGPTRTGTPEAEAACVSAVNLTTGDSSAVVLSSDFSEAGSLVMVRAEDSVTYRCLASNDGEVAELAITG